MQTNAPRDILTMLIQQAGPDLCDDVQRLENLLKDLCPEHPLETAVLVSATKAGVPRALASTSSPVAAVTRLRTQLVDRQGLSDANALWAVESWGVALGMITAQQCTTPPRLVAPAASGIQRVATAASRSEPVDRYYRAWKEDLLDYSRRNPLLYYRPTKTSSLEILEPDITTLYSKLYLRPAKLAFPHYRTEIIPAQPEEHDEIGHRRRHRYRYVLERRGNLLADKEEGELLRALANVRNRARTSRAELGLNTLYLALGLLRWVDPNRVEETAYAPLVLVPVNVERTTGKGRYSLVYFDEEIVVNPTLAAYMSDPRIGYDVELPPFRAEDDNLTTFTGYLEALDDLVSSRGWSVEHRAVLRSFSFHTIRMAEDLEEARTHHYYPGVVRMLAGEPASAATAPSQTAQTPVTDLDTAIHPRDLFQVLDADASQLSALAAARSGDHLVIHGPPGTGKSQTIVNLIVQSVAEGKTVLFVSQKNAALEVVYRRLTEIDLDIFCLPVHSDRANKRAVLDKIQRVYAPSHAEATPAPDQDYESLYRRRCYLNEVADELNRPLGLLQWTIQQVHGHLFRLRDVPDVGSNIGLEGFSYLEVDNAEWESKQAAARRLTAAYRKLGGQPQRHPWRGLTRQTTPAVRAEIRAAVEHLHAILETIEGFCTRAAPSLRLPVPDRRSGLVWLTAVARQLTAVPDVRPAWLVDMDLDDLAREVKNGRKESETIQTGRAALAQAGASESFYLLDHAGLRRQFAQGSNRIADLMNTPYKPGDRELRDALAAAVQDAEHAALEVRDRCRDLSTALGMPVPPTDHWLLWGGELARLCATGVHPAPAWFDSPKLEELAELLENAALESQLYREARSRILARWMPEALSLDAGELSKQAEAFHSPLHRLMSAAYRTWRLELAPVWTADTSPPRYKAITELITDRQRMVHARRWYDEHAEPLREAIGTYYRGVETDHEALQQAIDRTRQIVEHFGKIAITPGVRRLLTEGKIDAATWADLHTSARAAAAHLTRALNALDDYLMPDAYRRHILRGPKKKMVHAEDLIDLARRTLAALTQMNEAYDRTIPHLIAPPPIETATLDDWLQTALTVLKTEAAIARRDAYRHRAFGTAYAGTATDWSRLEDAVVYLRRLKNRLDGSDPNQDSTPPGDVQFESFAEILTDRAPLERQAAHVHARGAELLDQFDAAFRQLAENFAGDAGVFAAQRPCKLPFAQITERIRELRDHSDRLNDWQQYRDSLATVKRCGLGNLTREALDDKGLPPPLFAQIVEKRFYQLWISEAYTQIEHAGQLQPEQLQRDINAFCALDEALMVDQRHRVLRAWQSRRPAVSGSVPNSQAGMLMREFQKRRAHMPLRRLFGQLPELILALKPCLLMSPLSVAAYLDLETFYRRFDLVVFDEASQVRPAYAVGALLRAKQAVVVGDMKQLPPTDFFRVSREMDDYVEEDDNQESLPPESLESVLGEFITMPGVRQSNLRWHYRSRHEALIQFSNHRYYNDRLITFPAPLVPNASRSGTIQTEEAPPLRCVRVDGIYDRGKSRQNQAEARRVIELIAEHLRTFGATRTLGIITMSTAQEHAIRDELQYQQIAAALPVLRRYRAFLNEDAHTPEPFFIKSLERVQGDERDSIIISIGYGPDAEGRVYQNFGPLVMEGGERRLNVAITRAKHNLTLVTSLAPGDIQISEESKPGLVHLKDYIAYAQQPYPRATRDSSGGNGAVGAFERAVRDALEAEGYVVDSRVGTGVYTIDLAVRHPSQPQRYLVGIESDGQTYAAAATARDRHRLRRQMLETIMGWDLVSLWSKAWAERPHLTLEDLQATLEQLLATPTAAPNRGPEEGIEDPRMQSPDTEKPVLADRDAASGQRQPSDPLGDAADDSWKEALHTDVYIPYTIRRSYTMEQFYEDQALRDRCLLAIVRAEAPVHETVVLARLADCFQFSRATAKFKQTACAAMQRLAAQGALHTGGGFIATQPPNPLVTPRVPAPGAEPRRMAHIPRAEIAELCRQIAGQIYGIHQDALARQATYILGHPVLTARRKARVLEAIRWLEAQGAITVKNGYVFIVESH